MIYPLIHILLSVIWSSRNIDFSFVKFGYKLHKEAFKSFQCIFLINTAFLQTPNLKYCHYGNLLACITASSSKKYNLVL
jgi:hypothetical protein